VKALAVLVLGLAALIGATAVPWAAGGRLACTAFPRPAAAVAHVELFVDGRVVLLPPGIGVHGAERDGAVVMDGRCAYPVRTLDPTGVLFLDRTDLTLQAVFALWGRRLAPDGLLGRDGRVEAFVGGRRWAGDVRNIPLHDRAQIVVEVGRHVRPHARYTFPRRIETCVGWC
jgi:hypothetical protein